MMTHFVPSNIQNSKVGWFKLITAATASSKTTQLVKGIQLSDVVMIQPNISTFL